MTRWTILIIILFATEAVARPAVVGDVERKFQTYMSDMENMRKKCLGQTKPANKTSGLKCMCDHIGSLLTFKELVIKAAKEHPNQLVTLKAGGQAKSVNLSSLASSLDETKKLETLCANPEKTSLGLQAFAIKAKQAIAKTRLAHIYTMQQMHKAEYDKFLKFPTLGSGAKGCKFPRLSIDLGDCKEDPYQYSVIVDEAGKGFKAQARTLTGQQNQLIPGCETADVWTIDHNKQVSHVVDAIASCQVQ